MLRLTCRVLFSGFLMLFVLDVQADVYKYVDSSGAIYFTDSPLKGGTYRLEWHREAKGLIEENRQLLVRIKERSSFSVIKPPPALSMTMKKRRSLYEDLIRLNAVRYGLSPELLHSVIRVESAYNHAAVSSAGAQGLMQLMPQTALRYGVTNSFDPAQNVRGGAAYLRDLLDMFDQDVSLALAGYNAGEGAVMKYGRKIPPYSETQNYVRKVLGCLAQERSNKRILMSVR